MTAITDWCVVGGSKTVEFILDDSFMGAVDLREEMPPSGGRFRLADDRTGLVLPDGRQLSADRLRERCLDPRPIVGRYPMTAGDFAEWADDGSDVRWELQGGIPVPPPATRIGKGRVSMEIVCALMDHLEPAGDAGRALPWMALMGAWVCSGPDAHDCRRLDLVVYPRSLVTLDSLWVDDPVVVGQVQETGKEWLTDRRIAFARQMPTVREVVVVDWRCRWARVERRLGAGWKVQQIPAGGVLSLATLDWSVNLGDVLAQADR